MASGTVGTGAQINISGYTANLLSISGPSMSRAGVEFSYMDTTDWHTYTPGDLTDPGELTCEFELQTTQFPPITATSNTITIIISTGQNWVTSGFCTAFSPSIEMEDRMTASVTFKLTGSVAVSTT